MALSDTQIHHVELLLTLDYLLNNTDEKHPATQQAICMHARHFGYHYDPSAKSGNDVRRQRIGGCLSFLYELSQKSQDRLPFVIKKTESNKYYIESKGGLIDNQIAEIVMAILNEKFISQEETERLISQTLKAFSSSGERRVAINAKAEALSKNVLKYSYFSSRNLRLVMTALTNGLLIKIDRSPSGEESRREEGSLTMMKDFDWYRVYQIKEYKNSYYAILLPVGGGDLLFKPIDELNIPYDGDVLIDDLNTRRDLNSLFLKNSKDNCGVMSKSLKGFIKASKMPVAGGHLLIASFYFRKKDLDMVRRKYEQFFGSKMVYMTTSFKEIQKFSRPKNTFPNEVVDGGYYYVSTTINSLSFRSWLMSDFHESGKMTVGEMVGVLEPVLVMKEMAERYKTLEKRYSPYLNKHDELGG